MAYYGGRTNEFLAEAPTLSAPLLMHLGDEAQECGALLHECHRQTRQLASLCEHRHRELASYAEAAERRVRVPRGDDAVWDEAPIYACLESVSSGL